MKSVKSINPFKSVIQKSYDIIKAHGGELKVETREVRLNDETGQSEGAEFTMHLPIN